jgi:putative intracellular protease/amidase
MNWFNSRRKALRMHRDIKRLREFIKVYDEINRKRRRDSVISDNNYMRGWNKGAADAFRQVYETLDERLTEILRGR